MPIEEWTWIINDVKDPASETTGSGVLAIAPLAEDIANKLDQAQSKSQSSSGEPVIDPHLQEPPASQSPSPPEFSSSGGRPTIAGPLSSSGEFKPPTAAISYSGGHQAARSDAEPLPKSLEPGFSSAREFREEMRARLKTGETPTIAEIPQPPEAQDVTPKAGPKEEDRYFISAKKADALPPIDHQEREGRKAANRNAGSLSKPITPKKNAPLIMSLVSILLLGAAYLLLVVIGNKFSGDGPAESDLPPLPNDQTFDPLNPMTDRWEKYFHAGEQARGQGNRSEAIKYFTAAIKQNPKKLLAYHARGLVYLSLKNYPKAKADFTSALAIDSRNVQVLNAKAAVEFFMEHYPQAIDDYNTALSIDPRNADALFGRALNKYKWGRFPDALVDLKALLEDHPDYERAYQQKGEIHFALAEYAKALDDYSQALKLTGDSDARLNERAVLYKSRGATYSKLRRLREAFDDYSMAIRLDPNGWEYYSGRAFVCVEVSRPFQAVQDLKTAIDLNPYDVQLGLTMRLTCEKAIQATKHVLVKKPKDATAGGEQAYAYLYLGDFAQAEKAARKVLSFKPKDVRANLVLGESLYSSRKAYKASLDALNEALSVEPDNTEVLMAHAKTLRGLERYDEALNDYNLVISKNAKNSVAFNNRGIAYAQLKQYDNALKDLQEAVRLCPQSAEAQANIGRVYASMSKWDEAIEAFSLAIGNAPRQADMLEERGVAYNMAGDSESALADFDTALEVRPSSARINSQRATTLRKLGRYEAALSAVDAAMRLAPKEGLLIAERGRIRFMLNKTDEAIEDLSKAIETDPRNVSLLADRSLFYLVNKSFENAWKDSDKAATIAGWRHPEAWQIAMLRWCAQMQLKNSQAADVILAEALSNCPQNSWTYTILEYAAGKTTVDKVLANPELTGDGPSAVRAWIGVVDAVIGKRAEALTQLEWLDKRSTSPVGRLVKSLVQDT